MRIPLMALSLVALVYIPFGENRSAVLSERSTRDLVVEQAWVDSVYNSLDLDERIAQLMMVRAHSNKGTAHEQAVMDLVKNKKVGGLCFFQGTPDKQAELCNGYQEAAKTPLLIAMDAEWGLGMRMKASTISFPRQLTLGAIQNNRLLYDMGAEVARQCRRLGVHVNFAPVVDVNNNPANPVIGDRSFGEDRHNVTAKSFMYAIGMQDHQVMACAKHFPGHGDTDTDSHYDLPIIEHTVARLDTIELYPFKALAQHGIQSMMMGHLNIPSLDNTPNLPSSLSPKVVSELLQDDLNFDGLIFTDGLGMQGASKYFSPGEIEVKALIAGNDVLLLPQDVPAAMKAIKAAISNGSLSEAAIETKVKKLLHYKHQLGLHETQTINRNDLMADLNHPKALALKEKLVKNAITLVRNDQGVVPVKDLVHNKIATLALGSYQRTTFQQTIDNYARVEHYNTGKAIKSSSINAWAKTLSAYDIVFISLHDMSRKSSADFGVTESSRKLIEALNGKTQVVLTAFGSPYSMKFFPDVNGLICAYGDDGLNQSMAAQGIFGAFGFKGRLPVTASASAPYGAGLDSEYLGRLQFSIPESAGMDSKILAGIDAVAREAIQIGATPGCQILVAKEGKVVYNKSFGYHTYARQTLVKPNDLFDLASVTKIAAATISVMKLHEEGKVNIYNPIGNYLPFLKGSNKEGLIIRDILAHHAGLKAWIPFYTETLTDKKALDPKIYRSSKSGKFNVEVARKVFMHESYVDSIWTKIKDSELREKRDYRYSDLGFYLFAALVKEVSGQSIDDFVEVHFYQPMGLSTMTYNPLEKFDSKRIVPSERDKYFRQQSIRGHVHDMGAAMLGGVSGHAGLFANANDVAVILQMLLNDGVYGGVRYFKPETIATFTTRYERSTRRGIGFDMLETNAAKSPNFSQLASEQTFGHLGFTGIGAWADPQNELIYIFLSNRT
ncbi:MAG: glycoside hydrolase family 3 N-terminal domain-containing protein, partial [Bacteroidota bacterium]